jgi:CheY-like chemotaxis protein
MPKILIVDDEPVVHILYGRALKQAGFEVLMAKNGVETLAILQHTLPDLILMDIMMPAKDGLATLREIKANEATRIVPVIIITGNVDYYCDDRAQAKGWGAEWLLTKPLSPAKLVAEVQRIFAQHVAQG